MSKGTMARSWRLFHLSARRADAEETVSMSEPVGDLSFHRFSHSNERGRCWALLLMTLSLVARSSISVAGHLARNPLASMGLAVLAEQQRGDFHQITAPDGEIVQTLGGIKSVPDFVRGQKCREFLVPLERRVLPAATDPQLFQLLVGSIRI